MGFEVLNYGIRIRKQNLNRDQKKERRRAFQAERTTCVSVLGGNMLCMNFRNSESKGDGDVARDLRSR